jgi:phosphatidylinositol alpha-1,6-mannosyltransferase
LYIWQLLLQRFDFVWIFFAGYGEAEALALLPRQRYGVVFHYPFDEVPHRYDEFRRYHLIDRAAQVVSVSQLVADGVCEQLGCASAVIHHGVDTQRFAPDQHARAAVRQSLKIGPDTPLIVTAAALEERKGVQRVLYALPSIRRALPDVTYAILGDGPYRVTLERMAGDLGVADCVHFLGARANIAPFYQAADLSAILAHGEASSLVALESLACAVPVIAADWRPFDELIDGDDGIRVPADDARQVAQTMIDLLQNPAQRRAMGERGRARIIRDFQWDHVATQYIQLLASLV